MAYRVKSFIVGTSAEGGSVGSDVENVKIGIEAVKQLANNSDWDSAWIVTNTLADVDGQEAIVQGVGRNAAKALRARQGVGIGGAVRLFHATAKTIRDRGVGGAILAVYPSPDLLARLDDLMRPNSVVVIPWLADDVRAWVETWGPVNILVDGPAPVPLTISDDEVREAVRRLTSSTTGLGHPSDEKHARDTFSRLRRRKCPIDAREIRAYVVRETGWGTVQAEQLARIAVGRGTA